MTTSSHKSEITALHVHCDEDSLTVDLEDGRTISVPLAWFPRLLHATLGQRGNWKLLGSGSGIHWPEIDEDISVEALLLGTPSIETKRKANNGNNLEKAI